MNIWHLVLREIRFRSLNFVLSIVSILAATGCLVAAIASLQVQDLRIQDLSAKKKAEMESVMKDFEDTTRRTMLRLGFNVLIVHKDEDRQKLLAGQAPANTMPESYVAQLAGSKDSDKVEKGVASLNHLLPILREHLIWDDSASARNLAANLVLQGASSGLARIMAARTALRAKPFNFPVIVSGTLGEVPIVGGAEKRPLIPAVSSGSILIGDGIYQATGFLPGSEAELTLVREVRYGNTIETERLTPARFKVEAVLPKRGNEHDITIWLNLPDAQKLLRKPGLINGIFALECVSPDCPGDRFQDVETEIARRLPGTQVVPYYSAAAVRAAARSKAAALARETIGREIEQQTRLKQQHENLAAMLVPLVMLGCVIWLGLLAFSNVRDRLEEIGILRALGVRSRQVFALFMSKSALSGIAGGLLGYACGLGAIYLWSRTPEAAGSVDLFQPVLLLAVLVGAPLLGALASLAPALWAARQDPALILQHE